MSKISKISKALKLIRGLMKGRKPLKYGKGLPEPMKSKRAAAKRRASRKKANESRKTIRRTETPEQREVRLAKEREQQRRHRAKETPKKREARLVQERAANRRYRARQKAKPETPEKKEARLAYHRQKNKEYRARQKETETPEKREARRAYQRDAQRRSRAKKRAAQRAAAKANIERLENSLKEIDKQIAKTRHSPRLADHPEMKKKRAELQAQKKEVKQNLQAAQEANARLRSGKETKKEGLYSATTPDPALPPRIQGQTMSAAEELEALRSKLGRLKSPAKKKATQVRIKELEAETKKGKK